MGRLDAVREASAAVAAGARWVRIDEAGLDALASRLAAERMPAPAWDEALHHRGTPESTLAFVLTLDAVNFGSGWFPRLRKRPGLSGYRTVALCLKERFDADGPWSAAELAAMTPDACARVFGQTDAGPEVAELMELFARALRDLGGFLERGFDGRFAGPVEEAGGSAETLVGLLVQMPFFDDVQAWRGRPVPFYKRAQLAAADLHLALHGRGLGEFDDLERLTLFADNLVPHVLRCQGVLVYEPSLAKRIDGEERLEADSEPEVEIRACAVHAVERLAEALRRRGAPAAPWRLDYALWWRGQRAEFKARPRHRARSVFY